MESELCASAAYQDLLANHDLQDQFDHLARHRTRVERTFHRSLKELKALETNAVMHKSLSAPLARMPRSATEIAKRTQCFGARQKMTHVCSRELTRHAQDRRLGRVSE
jgi:hypothetical protein